MASAGEQIVNAIIEGKMVRAECPDSPASSCVIVWSANIYEQIDQLVDAQKQLPQIKPLVWVDVFRDDNHAGIKAETTFGKFCITVVEAIGCYVSAAPFYNWPFKECKSEAEAKAWCQSEYERRVRECLE